MIIYFEWKRDRKGYRLSEDKSRVISLGGSKVVTRPLDASSGERLYAAFARISSPKDVLEFVRSHGLIDSNSDSEEVATILSWSSWFREVLEAKDQNWESGLRRLLNEEPSDPVFAEVKTEYDSDGAFRFRIRPFSLLDALRLQLAQLIAGSGKVETCVECGTVFMTGVDGGRRRGAKFCCPAHQKRFNSLKRG